MYWNEKIETMSRDELMNLQETRLKDMVHRIYNNVPFYKLKFDELGILPGDVKSLDDLAKLPFTVKTDLRDEYPTGLQAVPSTDIVRFHASSGTTGKPIVAPYTKQDLNMWADCVARCLSVVGMNKDDILQISYGFGLFTGGFGLYGGAELMGCGIVPISSGQDAKQIMLMQDLKTTALACTPSYALFLSELIMEAGLTPEQIPLKYGIFGAEPWTAEMRKTLEARLGIEAHDIYGLTEVMGPGVGIDCKEHCGIHIWEDNFIIEIIDPETGAVLPPGSLGEVVFTSITKTGMPILRYRTRDLSRIFIDKCGCGRTHARMDKICGRSDDMMVIRGVNVFPSQIEAVLLNLNMTSPHFHIIVDRQGALDTMEVQIEITPAMINDTVKNLEALRQNIVNKIRDVLGLTVKVTLVEPKTIPRSTGKNKLVTDLRKNISF